MQTAVEIKSRAFAIRVVRVYNYLCDEKREFVMSKQLMRAGTSIGANVAEAECGISKKDFLAKMYIAFKECAETLYWLDLLKETDYLSQKEYDSLDADCRELTKILSKITQTTKKQLEKNSDSDVA
ncbi:MAG: four helix bundle protein [Paludibacteraceae bacterium]